MSAQNDASERIASGLGAVAAQLGELRREARELRRLLREDARPADLGGTAAVLAARCERAMSIAADLRALAIRAAELSLRAAPVTDHDGEASGAAAGLRRGGR